MTEDGKKYIVAVVDDERIIREGISSVLQKKFSEKAKIVSAKNGKEALLLFEDMQNSRESVDVILTDIVMPELDGLGLIECCRKKVIGSQYLILTSHDDFSFAQKAIRCGVSDFVLKPCNTEELFAAIEKALGKSNPRKNQINVCEQVYSLPLKASISYLNEHLGDKGMNLMRLSNESAFVNPDYLGKLFKKETGLKFNDFLLKLRIEKAMELLLETDLSLQEIAEKCGYAENSAYFCVQFKKIQGMTPGEFRKNRTAVQLIP